MEPTSQLSALAGACLAAVGWEPANSPAQRQAFGAKEFRAACSLRLAIPVGDARVGGLVLVSTDVRGGNVAPSFCAFPADGSMVGATLLGGRTAAVEGPTLHSFPDLSQFNRAEGSHSFLCVPILHGGGTAAAPAVAALLLSYTSTAAAPQAELRQALLLAGELTQHYSADLRAHAAHLGATLNPSVHPRWGPGVDEVYPELSGSECSSADEDLSSLSDSGSGFPTTGSSSSGGMGFEPVVLDLPRRSQRRRSSSFSLSWADCEMDPRTLWFSDARLEKRFRRWHNSRLARVDGTALMSLLVYHGVSSILPPIVGCQPGWLSSVLPALTVMVPLLALLLSPSKRWYSRYRDQLMMGTYLLLACHQALDLAAQLARAPQGLWHVVVLFAETLWCMVLGIILQVQFVGQCFMVLASLVVSALVRPGAAHHPPSGTQTCMLLPLPGGCLLDDAARALLLKIALPCALVYCMEKAARRAFCRSLSPAIR